MFGACSLNLNAAKIVDVYGATPSDAQHIIKNYGTAVGEIESQFVNEMIKLSNGGKDDYMEHVLLPKRTQLIDKIKQRYNFAFVQFDTVVYPNDKDTHTTIEVITHNDKQRLKFIPPKNKTPDPTALPHDLVDNMMKFNDKSTNLLLNNQLDPQVTQCPVYHCLPGFNHAELKDAFLMQTRQAAQEKTQLMTTIASDPHPQRRVAAIYLIGYLNDPHEIISLLTQYVTDADDGVRNSAMRVIAETMQKAKINTIDVKPFIELLNSPYDTDRNKAL